MLLKGICDRLLAGVRNKSYFPHRTRSTPNHSNLFNSISFDFYIAIERLEAVLRSPEDNCLLLELSCRYANHKQAGLSIVWAFAMTKGGAMAQHWRVGEPWHRTTVEDHPDGFSPNEAYWCLQLCLPDRKDKKLLRDLRRENENMGYIETASWAIWQFAMAKGKESSREWSSDQNAARARESMGEIPRGRCERFRRQWRLRWNMIRSPLRNRLRSTSSSQSHSQEPRLSRLNYLYKDDLSSSTPRFLHIRPARASSERER